MAEELHRGALGPQDSGGIQPLSSLAVLLTSRCNLACSYCYRGQQQRERDLDWPRLRIALDWAVRAAGPRLEFIWTGGEPLLVFATLARAMAYLATRAGPRISHLILTNGLLLGEKLDRLDRGDVRIQLSHDGVAAAQDLRGRGTWTALDRLLVDLARERPSLLERRLCVAVTVHPENLSHLAEGVAHLLAHGVRDILLSPTLSPVPSWDGRGRDTLEVQFAVLHALCREHERQQGTVPLRLFQRPRRRSAPLAGQRWECGAFLGRAVAVGLDGLIYACPLFAPGGGERPPADTEDLAGAMLWGEPGSPECERRRASNRDRLEAQTSLRTDRRQGRCAACPSFPSCRICPWATLWLPARDRGRVPAFLCDFHRIALAWRRRYPASGPSASADRLSSIESERQAWLRALGWHRAIRP
jgi:uncharacterized protein